MEQGITNAFAGKPPPSPLRTNRNIHLSAIVSRDDIDSQRISIPATNQVHLTGSIKVHSRNAFETVFDPETTQTQLSEALIPKMTNQLFNGTDAAFIALGAKSQCKESLLYDNKENKAGLFQGVITALFEKVDELKAQQPDSRHQVRMSALMYSQRDSNVLDLLSPFNSDPRRRSIKITDDARMGVSIENESEVKVDSSEQALFYLNTVIDHRIVQEPETYRTSHLLVFLSLYAFRTGTNSLEGGRSRLALIDLGIGERNSTKGELTMPAIGGILLALCQGQKYIPARENALSLLLKYSLSTARLSQFLFSFGEKQDDNENIVQLASKMSRTKKAANNLALKREKPSSDGASISSNERRRRELESGSEFSAPETVIYLGPSGASSSGASGTPTPRALRRTTSGGLSIPPPRSPSANSRLTGTTDSCSIRTCAGSIPPMLKGHTPFLSSALKLYDDLCSPPSTSANHLNNMTYPDLTAFGGKSNQDRDDFGITIATPRKSRSRYNLDDGKRQAIINWMENCDPPPAENELYLDERRECGILSYPLEDIIEQEEESSRGTNSSLKSKRDHPLRILSKEALLEKVDSQDTMQEAIDELNRANDDEETRMQEALEKALEAATASISSLRSHEILAKLNGDLSPEMTNTISVTATTGTPSETDMYRRASHLEEYAMQRVKELEQERLKGKKKNRFDRLGLNCCQASSMASSTSTAPNDNSQTDKNDFEKLDKIDEERRKEDLRRRREVLRLEELEIKREKRMISKELDDKPSFTCALARQVTLQLHQLAMGPGKGHRPRLTSDSLPTTPTHSHRKISSTSPQRTPSSTYYTSPIHQSHQSLPRHSKIAATTSGMANGSVPHKQRSDGSGSRKTSRTRPEKPEKRERDRERRSSLPKEPKSVPVDEMPITSPYAKMTSPKQSAGGTSSGRGSEDNSSSLVKGKRQSYSASSGYESDPYSRIEKMGGMVDKKMSINREVEMLKERQRRLRIELKEAKERIGQIEDVKTIGGFHKVPNSVSPTTLADALVQENRILEKRLIACRNHTMLVTMI